MANQQWEDVMVRLGALLLGVVFCLGLILGQAGPGAAAGVDYRIYAGLLDKYVHEGLVDYAGFKKDEKKLDEFLGVLEKVDTTALSRDEQMAFYINAYNAWTIKLILGGYPGVESIKDLGSLFSSPWKKEIVRIEGKVLTLDNLEHDILRPRYKDPRVHFAVNCASKSCPPLISRPYTGANLREQLEANAVAFINDPQKNYLKGDELFVSRIFDWFSEDFNGGDIKAFFIKYAKGDLRDRLETSKGSIDIEYLDYDWSLNGK